MLRDPRMLLFVFVWLGLNVLLGLPLFSMPGVEGSVAWQAHLGGIPRRSSRLRGIRSCPDAAGD